MLNIDSQNYSIRRGLILMCLKGIKGSFDAIFNVYSNHYQIAPNFISINLELNKVCCTTTILFEWFTSFADTQGIESIFSKSAWDFYDIFVTFVKERMHQRILLSLTALNINNKRKRQRGARPAPGMLREKRDVPERTTEEAPCERCHMVRYRCAHPTLLGPLADPFL